MNAPQTPAGRPESERIRLNKYLALNGIASRRHADRLITEGEVMVDGDIVTELGMQIDPATQRVEVDGVVLRPQGERLQYYLLNKPKGVVCTNDPREGRRRAIDLIGDRRKGRIYTVGRLDEETMGIVILTNDGEFAQRIAHPKYGVEKTYRAVVRGRIDEDTMRKLRGGVRLADFKSNFERVKVMKSTDLQTTLLVTLSEGRNREVRRVFARVGHPVKSLARVEIGNLKEGILRLGHWRPLMKSEITELLKLAEEGPPRRRPRRPGGQDGRASNFHGNRRP